MSKEVKPFCSLCGVEAKQASNIVFFFLSQKNMYICSLCVDDLYHYEPSVITDIFDTPNTMINILLKHIHGQDRALASIAVAIFKHSLYINKKIDHNSYRKIKSNSLIIGPTGSGKTYTLELIANMLDIPIIIVDMSLITAMGYVGEDVEGIIAKLIKQANYVIAKASIGIIVFDEFDKVAKKEVVNQKDIGGEAVQQELLKIIEGCKMEIGLENKRYQLQTKTATIDTSGMLFFGLGAFDGIDQLMGTQGHVEKSNYKMNFTHEEAGEDFNIKLNSALNKYGIIPELRGRFTNVIRFNNLTTDDIITILKSKDSVINIYKRLLVSYGIDTVVTDEAYAEIARKSIILKTGARGAYSISNKIFEYVVKNISNIEKTLNIDIQFINQVVNTAV